MNKVTENLWITNYRTASTTDENFDRVVSVCSDNVRDNVACPNPQFPLADGKPHAGIFPGQRVCSYELFEEAVLEVVASLEYDERVLVHCHAGISRAVSVSVAAYAIVHNEDYDDAEEYVGDKRPNSPNKRLLGYAEAVVENYDRGGSDE